MRDKTSRMWYVLMVMYLLYFTQASIFPGAAIIGQVLIFLILCIGFVNLLRTLSRSVLMPNSFGWIIALLIVATVGFLISPSTVQSRLLDRTSTLNQFKDWAAFFLPVFTGFQIGLHKKISPRQGLIVTLIFLAIAISSFFNTKAALLERFNLEETTNNAGYIFVYLLCFLPLFLKNYKFFGLAILITAFIFIMIAAKRGAILCMAILLLYEIKWYMGRRLSLKTFLAIAIVITGAVIGIMYFMATDALLQQRFEQTMEGNSSARDYLYAKLWDAWIEADGVTQLFGRGTAQTVMVCGNYAHNDWLELLTDYGLLSAFLYLAIIVSLFRYSRKLPAGSAQRCALTLVIILWALKTVFSMGMSVMGGISMMLIGTLIGNSMVRSRKRAIKQSIRM